MKKLSLGFGVAVVLLISTSCFAQSTSGVDLGSSRFRVSYWRPSNDAYAPPISSFQCLGGSTAIVNCGKWGEDTPCTLSLGLTSFPLFRAFIDNNYSSETYRQMLNPDEPLITEIANDGTNNCFHLSGHYEVELELHDFAGNTTTTTPVEFEIMPTSPDGDTSLFSENCSQDSAIPADGDTSSVCALKLSIRDQYSNPVHQLVGSTSSFQGDIPADAGDANEGISFLEGLRMRDGGSWKSFPDLGSSPESIDNIDAVAVTDPVTNPLPGVIASFEVGSIAPSLRRVGPAAEDETTAATLSEVSPIPVDFVLSLPTINRDGTVNSSNMVPMQTRASLQFLPPFEIFPTIRGEDGFVQVSAPEDPAMLETGSITWLENYPVELTFPIQNYDPDTWSPTALNQISNVTLGRTGIGVDGIRMGNGSLGTVLAATDLEDFTGLAYPSPHADFQGPAGLTTTHIVSTPQTDTSNITLGVGSILAYDIEDPLSPGSTQTVAYAAGGVGSRNDFWDTDPIDGNGPNDARNLVGYYYAPSEQVIGAHIVGGILGAENQLTVDVHGESSSVIQQSSFDDLRAKITENAYRLRRGRGSAENSEYIFSGSTAIGEAQMQLFDDTNDVLIVDADGGNVDITYGILPEGNNTIIVFDGNLSIQTSLEYQNASDSMGFIVINSDLAQGGGQLSLTERRDMGNIWVRNTDTLQRLVGTYFADGGLMAMPQGIHTVMKGNTDNGAGNDRSYQLLLTGALYTRNTLGGSNANNEAGMFFDPWGKATQDDAKIYDLHEVRTYNYVDLLDDPSTPLVNEEYDHTDFCVRKLDEPTECIDDNASFVIQLDRKVTSPRTTPPGFEVQSSISR